MRRRDVIGSGIVLIGLGACATTPRQQFQRAAAPELNRVGILTPALGEPNGVLVHSVGAGFGLIGGLIETAMADARRKQLGALLVRQQIAPADVLTAAMVSGLDRRGFVGFAVAAARPKQEFLASYPPRGDEAADAWLDVAARNWGFVADNVGRPWSPFVDVNVRLVRAGTESVLMQDRVGLNPEGVPSGIGLGPPGVMLPASGHASFPTFAALTAESDRAAEGLRIALENVALGIAGLMA